MKSTGDMDRRHEEPKIPEAIPVNFDGIPPELQRYPSVVWKYQVIEGDVKKPPFNPKTGKRASVADPNTWGSFNEAKEAYLTGKWGKWDGVGIVLLENGGLVGIDIDDCIHNGSIKPDALHIISVLNTFTELSPSIPEGEKMPTGVHLWVKGKLPGRFCRNDALKVEMYERGRYITVTGHHIHGSRGYLQAKQDRLAAVYNEVFAYTDPILKDTGGGIERGGSRYFTYVTDQRALERAYRTNYADKFRRLYEGDMSLWEGEGATYPSQSNADFVLVLYLLRVTNNDTEQVDRLFRMSGLMRPKWDRKVNKYQTYGERIIKRALEIRKGS
jgi:putative DNA primase/helicase